MPDYNFKEAEEKLKKYWQEQKIYKFNPEKKGKIFAIDTPPPTVSGKMHIGHAFQYSQQDFIARFYRMKENVFCPFGTDDNGLPTERLIEKLNGIKSKDMARTDFIKLCLNTLKEITPGFIQDWKDLGVSCDYDISYSTIDDNSRKLSQKSFIELYKKGRIYKTKFPTIWCPECSTAIAQAELEDKELPSLFSTIKFSCEDKELLIATTRPELIGACVAVFVNPQDSRYKDLIGKKAKVPLFDYEVPIIADPSADIEKGTGALMVCSYGDKYDVEAINKFKLEPRLIIEKNGKLNIEPYKGYIIKAARKQILEDLKNKNLILEQKQITHNVNVHDKCGTEIEFVTTEQWFIKILDLKEELINQAKKIKWHPGFMQKRYENWVRGLEWDWSISRDRHFGVPIPVWSCDCGETILAKESELPIDPLQIKKNCPKCQNEAKPEEKVFDTWMTSSISPQIASSLIDNKITIPYSMRNNAHDIIRTWDFYTITKSYLHEGKIPWENMMVSGYVTLGGEKMSKSKGNVIDPKKVLDEWGADVLRYWTAGSTLGTDTDYQEKDLVAGKKFITKLWNAANFAIMNLKEYNKEKPEKLEFIDELFLRKLNFIIIECTDSFNEYEYSKARATLEDFFWHDFCDNYLEIIKKRIYENKEGKLSAQYTLYKTLLDILKLIAPIMPFITEEIYQNYFKNFESTKSIHISDWPTYEEQKEFKELQVFFEVLKKVRQEKSNNKKSMKSEVNITIEKENYEIIKDLINDLKDVTNALEIKEGEFCVEFMQ
ncbi:MAG: valine--tRNA ligase [Candidatus Nanoarchaeia archaeon]